MLFTGFLVLLFLPLASIFVSFPWVPPAPEETTIDEKQHQAIKILTIAYVSNEFSDLENTLIEKACAEWERATNGAARFFVIREPNDTEVRLPRGHYTIQTIRFVPAVEDTPIIVIVDTLLGERISGYTDALNITEQKLETIYIVNGRMNNEQEYFKIATHELGHSMRLYHVSDKNSLMFPYVAQAPNCLVMNDLKQFCDIYTCDAESMEPCASRGEYPTCTTETYHLAELPKLK